MVRTTMILTAGSLLVCASGASAYVNTMYNMPVTPSSVGSLIASLDSSGYDYNNPANLDPGRLDSGFTADILDGGGNVLFTNDSTSLITEVFQVNTPTAVTDVSGDLNLQPGDLIFSYTFDLVDANPNAVETLAEFNLLAGTLFGNTDSFTADLVLGRGYSVAGLSNGTSAVPQAEAFDFDDDHAPLFSTLDWAFPSLQANQMQNAESISFLMFTRPALIEVGRSGFSGEPGQASATTDFTANGVPVLVPIVPAPGAGALVLLSGALALRRRQR